MSVYQYGFDPAAENNTAAHVYRTAMDGGPRVLDLGSGPGIVAAALAQAGRDVTCVDIDPVALEQASAAGVRRTVVADLSVADWHRPFAGERYDVVVLADVLEHLQDPGSVLDTLQESRVVAEDGLVVVSIPNAAHESVVAALLSGDFTYTRTGLLDATHLRFYTKSTFVALAEAHGYLVGRTLRTLRTLEQSERAHLTPEVDEALRRALATATADYRTYQYVFALRPGGTDGRINALRDTLDELRREQWHELEGLRREAKELRAKAEADRSEHERRVEVIQRQAETYRLEQGQLKQQLEAAREQHGHLEREAQSARDRAQSAATRVDDLRRERERLVESERRLQAKLQAVYSSETWRAGRALSYLPRRASRAFRRRQGSTRPATDAGTTAEAGSAAAAQALTVDRALRQVYERALERRSFAAAGGRRIVMGVSTSRLDDGRGDVYTAIGLGRYLEALGHEVIYLPPDEWYSLPPQTEVFVSLLAETKAMLDPSRLPASCVRLAWVRNLTQRWADSPTLKLYDGLLCSSKAMARALGRHYDGPLSVLPIGVDHELFRQRDSSSGAQGRAPVVVSTVNSWGSERELHRSLKAAGKDFPLALYGQRRGIPDELLPWSAGAVDYFSLPSAYGQATVVLDDVQAPNVGYGNVNSRIFESLACGALPVTNSGIGLLELGLDEVPVYGADVALDEVLHHVLSDDVRRDALVRRLQEVVVRDHSYAVRADRFEAFLDKDVLPSVAARRRRTVIGFFPNYLSTNPFQAMLYRESGQRGSLAVPVAGPRDLLARGLSDAAARVFHLHWTAPVLGPAQSVEDAESRRREFVAALDDLRSAGGKVVYTVHNALPHECAYPDVERQLLRDVVERCDLVHTMSVNTRDAVRDVVEIPAEKERVVAHGSYVDVYPDVVGRARARGRLGLSERATVLLFLGGIRPYKGLDDLLDAFAQLRREGSKFELVVAGSAGRFPGVQDLVLRCQEQEGVHAFVEKVPDDDLQYFLRACDVVVLPHRRVLNSGGLYLAWSFGRPVIAPDAGSVGSEIAKDTGLTFAPNDPSSLLRALRRANELTSAEVRRACYLRALRYDSRAMSVDFFDALEGVVPAEGGLMSQDEHQAASHGVIDEDDGSGSRRP